MRICFLVAHLLWLKLWPCSLKDSGVILRLRFFFCLFLDDLLDILGLRNFLLHNVQSLASLLFNKKQLLTCNNVILYCKQNNWYSFYEALFGLYILNFVCIKCVFLLFIYVNINTCITMCLCLYQLYLKQAISNWTMIMFIYF